MQAEISFRNKTKSVIVKNLQKIEFENAAGFHPDFIEDNDDLVVMEDNFQEFRLDNVYNEVTFIGDTTCTAIKSSIAFVLFSDSDN